MKLIIAALTLVSAPAFASVKTVHCEAQSGILYNQFAGSAVITLNEQDDTAKGVLNFVISRPGQPDLSVTGSMEGTYKDYAAGTFGQGPAQAIQFLDKGAKVSVAIINLGMPGPLTSTLIADSVTYKSACR